MKETAGVKKTLNQTELVGIYKKQMLNDNISDTVILRNVAIVTDFIDRINSIVKYSHIAESEIFNPEK